MEISKAFLLKSFPFLKVFFRIFTHKGKTGQWYFVSREDEPKVHAEKKKPDAVIIVGIKDGHVVLTSEFRVPIGAREIGFPAGLIDKDETVEAAAIREFREETGMELEILSKSPPHLYSSAGMTNESVQIVFGRASGEPNLSGNEATEDIEVMLIPQDKIQEMLYDETVAFGAKAWCILYGFI